MQIAEAGKRGIYRAKVITGFRVGLVFPLFTLLFFLFSKVERERVFSPLQKFGPFLWWLTIVFVSFRWLVDFFFLFIFEETFFLIFGNKSSW